jgi:hypothetical protein
MPGAPLVCQARRSSLPCQRDRNDDMMDLDEPADVYWPEDMSPNVVRGAHKKSCETIAEAVKFVMETLPEPFRAVAYMAAADKHLRFDEIRAIYESAEYKAFKA